jgi:putative NADH-flavin reductase
MKIVVFGATGRTGQCIVQQALEHGHTVTAFVRDPGKLAAHSGSVRFIVGDVLERKLVDKAVKGQDGVLCALGVSRDMQPAPILSEGTKNIIRAMEKHSVNRVVCVLSGWLFFQSAPPMFKAVTAEHNRQFSVLRQSSVEWIAVCPPQITDYPPIGSYRVAVDRLPDGGYRISKEELAEFMLSQLVDNEYVYQAVGIAN